MNQNTTAQKESRVKTIAPVMQWVTFTLANQIYGINVMQVQEVLRYSTVAPVPGAPAFIHGIINLRGDVVSVIDTRKRFNLPAGSITEQTRIIIIEVEKQVIGIMADNVADVIELSREDIENAPNIGNINTTEYVEGVCEHDGSLIILIDLNKLLTEAEWQEMSRL